MRDIYCPLPFAECLFSSVSEVKYPQKIALPMSCDVYVLVLFLLFSLHKGNSSSETKWPKLNKRKHILNRPLKMTLTYSGKSRMYWLGRGWGLENTQGRKDGWRKQYMKTFGVVDTLIIFLSRCTCMLTYQRRKKLEEGRKEGRKILVLLWNLDLEIINETAEVYVGSKAQLEVNHLDYFK